MRSRRFSLIFAEKSGSLALRTEKEDQETMKTTEYLGHEIRQDRSKRWWVLSSPFERNGFRTLKEAKELVREMERILGEFAEEIERNPEGSTIVAVKR